MRSMVFFAGVVVWTLAASAYAACADSCGWAAYGGLDPCGGGHGPRCDSRAWEQECLNVCAEYGANGTWAASVYDSDGTTNYGIHEAFAGTKSEATEEARSRCSANVVHRCDLRASWLIER